VVADLLPGLLELEGAGEPFRAALSARCFSWIARRSALLSSFMLGLDILGFPSVSPPVFEADASPAFAQIFWGRPLPWDGLLVVPEV